MRVLLLYQYLNHTSTVSALAYHLQHTDIKIECLDLQNLNFVSGRNGRRGFIKFLYCMWMKYGKCRRIFADYLRKKYILAQIQDFDIIDIHYYSLFYNGIIPEIKKKNKPFVIMIWGSDFYRSTKDNLKKRKLGFDAASIIHVESENVKDDFLRVFPDFSDKIYIVQFGLNQLDWIKNAMLAPIRETSLISINTFREKLVVTCGYNGSVGQQHLRMFESIAKLPKKTKDRIYLLIPFTYGGTEKYKKEVRDAVDKTGVSFTILDERLSDEQMIELRRISHIAINIQITDSFSASVQEHFMAGSVQIIGDWLPYEVFYEKGLFAIKTTLNDLENHVAEVVNNYDFYKKKCEHNSSMEYKFSSWQYVMPKWVEMYSKVWLNNCMASCTNNNGLAV